MSVAYCWANGTIEIGETLPEGALPIAHGESTTLLEAIQALATLAWNNCTMLVPGFLQVKTPGEQVDVVMSFAREVVKYLATLNSTSTTECTLSLKDKISAVALLQLIDNNLDEFQTYAGGEEKAAATWDALRRAAGLEAV